MVPARNLRRRHCDSYGAWFDETQFDSHRVKPSVRSNLVMADDNSQTGDDKEEEAEADDSWLRLGIGRSPGAPVDPTSTTCSNRELELFPDKPSSSSSSLFRPRPPLAGTSGVIPPMVPLFPPHGLSYRPWGSGFWNPNTMTAAAPMMTTPMLQYSFRRFEYPPASSGPSSDVRVVGPPPRPQAGVWFLLQASRNQVREPFLPQIPKSYLRIKDGRMTVGVLMKYLVNKLGLDDESEVEVTCRGEPLLPFLTLQHVRDHIWCLRAAVELFPDSPANDHVMTLHYGRSSIT